MFTKLAVRPETHEHAKAVANRVGLRLCDFVGEAVRRYDLLDLMLEADYGSLAFISEPGPHRGFAMTLEAYRELPRGIRLCIQDQWLLDDGRVEFTLISKDVIKHLAYTDRRE